MFRDLKIIRLRKRGHKKYHVFDIVVMLKYKKNRGDFLERIGFFNPNCRERILFLDLNKLGFWLNNGAILHDTLKKYIFKFII